MIFSYFERQRTVRWLVTVALYFHDINALCIYSTSIRMLVITLRGINVNDMQTILGGFRVQILQTDHIAALQVFSNRPRKAVIQVTLEVCPTVLSRTFRFDGAFTEEAREFRKIQFNICEERPISCDAGTKDGCGWLNLGPSIRSSYSDWKKI